MTAIGPWTQVQEGGFEGWASNPSPPLTIYVIAQGLSVPIC